MTGDQPPRGVLTDPTRLAAIEASGFRPGLIHDHVQQLVEVAARALDVPTVLVSIVAEDRQFFPAHTGLPEPWATRAETPLSMSICRHLVEDDDGPLVIGDLAADPRFREHAAREALGVGAYCGVPIVGADGQVLGSLCAVDGERRAWDERTVSLLSDLAGVVVSIAATYHDHQVLVSDLQHRLYPSDLAQPTQGRIEARVASAPEAPEIGGDFFDVHARDDGSVDIVLADAVGHGVVSTQAAAQLRAATSVLLSTVDDGPLGLLRRVSAAVDRLPGCDLATMAIVRIGADGSSARYAAAGAVPPLLAGADGYRVLDDASVPLLGLPWRQPVTEGYVELAPGEALLLCSDGLVERRGAVIDDGLRELGECACATDDLDRIVASMLGGREHTDDVTLVRWLRSH